MDGQKVLEVVATYRKFFEKRDIIKMDCPQNLILSNIIGVEELVLPHCHGMLDRVEGFIAEGRLEESFRWLGFIQGVLWLTGCYTLEELKNHNRLDTATEVI